MANEKKSNSILVLKVDGKDYKHEIPRGDANFGFTPREWGVIKRQAFIAGPMAFGDAMMALDPELTAVLAIVLMRRAGDPVDEDAMLDGAYTLELRFEEPDAGLPPTSAASGGARTSRASRTATTPAPTGDPS